MSTNYIAIAKKAGVPKYPKETNSYETPVFWFSDADVRYFSESLWLRQWRAGFVGCSHTNTARLFGIVPLY